MRNTPPFAAQTVNAGRGPALRRRAPVALLLALSLLAGCASTAAPAAAPRRTAFWPPFPDEPRIQFLVSFRSSADLAGARSGLDDLIYGREPQQVLLINKPYGLAMHDGRIYVCDLRNACITILDLRRRQTLIMGKTGGANLQRPSDIAIADDGTKYVADLGQGVIAVFDAQDRFAGLLGQKDQKPVGLAVHGQELYVCDFASQKVLVMDRRTGQLLRTIGEPGSGPGQFVRPLSVEADKDGNVLVMDVLTCRLQKFDRQGKLISAFGTISNAVGGLVRPKQIAVDSQGIIYVVDAAFQNVQLFNDAGKVFTFFGGAGNHPGGMFLPAGIAVHEGDLDLFAEYVHPAFQAERLLLVSNQFGDNKVSVYALGRLRAGKTVQDIAATKGVVPLRVEPGKVGMALPPATQPEATQPGGATGNAGAP